MHNFHHLFGNREICHLQLKTKLTNGYGAVFLYLFPPTVKISLQKLWSLCEFKSRNWNSYLMKFNPLRATAGKWVHCLWVEDFLLVWNNFLKVTRNEKRLLFKETNLGKTIWPWMNSESLNFHWPLKSFGKRDNFCTFKGKVLRNYHNRWFRISWWLIDWIKENFKQLFKCLNSRILWMIICSSLFIRAFSDGSRFICCIKI